jgi:hypothetical protein
MGDHVLIVVLGPDSEQGGNEGVAHLALVERVARNDVGSIVESSLAGGHSLFLVPSPLHRWFPKGADGKCYIQEKGVDGEVVVDAPRVSLLKSVSVRRRVLREGTWTLRTVVSSSCFWGRDGDAEG